MSQTTKKREKDGTAEAIESRLAESATGEIGFIPNEFKDAHEVDVDQIVKRRCKQVNDHRQGHTFKRTVARGHARVQYGDQINHISVSGDYYAASMLADTVESSDPTARNALSHSQHQAPSTRDVVLTAIIWKIFEELLLFLLGAVVALRNRHENLPRQIAENVTYFEDAFGRRARIDIDIIPDWVAFESLLFRKFQKRGYRKIQTGDYRLQDVSSQQLIVPRWRPSFKDLFRPGCHIRMSIYFEWEEVQYNGCPKCREEQATVPGVEVICSTCGFAFTPGIPVETVHRSSTHVEVALVSVSDDQAARPSNLVELHNNEPDRPEHFTRVAIGAQEIAPTQQEETTEVQQQQKVEVQPIVSTKGTGPTGASSYWSVPEQNDFVKYIGHFGRDFAAIAAHMGTKTQLMVKNHYRRQVDGGIGALETSAIQAEERRARNENIGPPPAPTPITKRRYNHEPTSVKEDLESDEFRAESPAPLKTSTEPGTRAMRFAAAAAHDAQAAQAAMRANYGRPASSRGRDSETTSPVDTGHDVHTYSYLPEAAANWLPQDTDDLNPPGWDYTAPSLEPFAEELYARNLQHPAFVYPRLGGSESPGSPLSGSQSYQQEDLMSPLGMSRGDMALFSPGMPEWERLAHVGEGPLAATAFEGTRAVASPYGERAGELLADLAEAEDFGSVGDIREAGRPKSAVAPTTFVEKEAEARAILLQASLRKDGLSNGLSASSSDVRVPPQSQGLETTAAMQRPPRRVLTPRSPSLHRGASPGQLNPAA